jgi:hypothetical protein
MIKQHGGEMKYNKQITGTPPQVLNGAEAYDYLNAPRERYSTVAKTFGSGRYEDTFKRLDTGEIFEYWESEFTGFLARLMVWATVEDYNSYREGLPFNVYYELGADSG